ncbi:MAG: DUF58 domain-containing protein, partial [Candidatus Limnocylindrales bacterium]
FLFYLLYLGILVVGGSYVLTRLGLTDLEAGYAVNQLHGRVGDTLRLTYTLRNAGRLPKVWLEVHNPTNLPGGLAGRALSLGPRGERSWVAKTPLTRRGHFRIEPLQIRTGDPFGLFEASAAVGQGLSLIVYPRVERLPLWRLPAASIEGSHAAPERTLQTTPLATSVRPYAPGDSMNRIHWKSTARHGEIQVKEFDLEQTSDAWIFLDLERRVQRGKGDESTVEVAVRAAASIADRALLENRAVGLTTIGHRTAVLPADRGGRQHLKIMQLLAAVDGDGATPLSEALLAGLPRLRRGMTAVVITPSLDRSWIRPLAALRMRGVACVTVVLDGPAYGRATDPGASGPSAASGAAGKSGAGAAGATTAAAATTGAAAAGGASTATIAPTAVATARDGGVRPLPSPEQEARALRHALAEYELPVHWLTPGRTLAEALA